MTRRLRLALLATLASCAPVPRSADPPPVAGGRCRIGPDGGPVGSREAAGEQGIGGTGGPVRLAERGIGGTGDAAASPGAVAPASVPSGGPGERGIGGTGIVGIITGFGSVCVDGFEVEYAAGLPVRSDTGPVPTSALRAGQVVVVSADGADPALRADSLAIRHEVVGPVELVGADRGLVVAGQVVRLSAETRVAAEPRLGDWVAVSGLRDPDGRIVASRIDRIDAGPVVARGLLRRDGEAFRIGGLRVLPLPGLAAEAGWWVVASGRIVDGTLMAEAIAPDPLYGDPAAAFGPGIKRFFLQSYVTTVNGGVSLGGGGLFGLEGDWAPIGGGRSRVVELRRQGDGSVRAAGLRDASVPGPYFGPATTSLGRGFDGGRDAARPGGARPPSASPDRGPRLDPAPVPSARFFEGGGSNRPAGPGFGPAGGGGGPGNPHGLAGPNGRDAPPGPGGFGPPGGGPGPNGPPRGR